MKSNVEAVTVSKKKGKPCTACKKKNVEINELPLIMDEPLFIPTPSDIKLAYEELYNKQLTQDQKDYIQKVYQFVFNEEFDFDCPNCVSTQSIKLRNYILYKLNLKL